MHSLVSCGVISLLACQCVMWVGRPKIQADQTLTSCQASLYTFDVGPHQRDPMQCNYISPCIPGSWLDRGI